MELRLERLWPKETYTIGRLYINNEKKKFMESQQFRMVLIR